MDRRHGPHSRDLTSDHSRVIIPDSVAAVMTAGTGGAKFEVHLDIAQAYVALSGELDLATVDALRQAAAVLLSSTSQHITIDLADLQFIDAAGLGEIARLRVTLLAAGRRLTLSRPSRKIHRTFVVGGLAELV